MKKFRAINLATGEVLENTKSGNNLRRDIERVVRRDNLWFDENNITRPHNKWKFYKISE